MSAEHLWIFGGIIVAQIIIFWIPMTIIIRRTGHSGWWILFGLVPLVGFSLGFWMLALARWPAIDRNSN